MNVLLLGGGGREHALAYKLSKSTKVKNLYIAPGNAGTMQHGENVPINPNDFDAIKQLIERKAIEMVVVGPEEPLVKGIYDYLKSFPELQSLRIIGPSKRGALLEGSKSFAKEFMFRHKIQTAKYFRVDQENLKHGLQFLETLNSPYVLKADGLAAGKGVVILDDLYEAKKTVADILGGRFGDAGKQLVIEEYLDGIEVSYFALTDGETFVLLPEAKDYKRIGDNNTGPNTGGMGSVSPVPFCDEEFTQKVIERIIQPTVEGLRIEDIQYCGFIFFGLMNCGGDPYVIEYNCRLGDPETQAVLMRIGNDLGDIFLAATQNELNTCKIDILPETVVTVVCANYGYPESYPKGQIVTGLNEVSDCIVFHAGTKMEGNEIVTNGGRVLAVTALGANIQQAREKAYKGLSSIQWPAKYNRSDIGLDLIHWKK